MDGSGQHRLDRPTVKARSAPLVRTKFHPPAAPRLMARDQLVEILRARQGAKLTLLCAPAGWGKSSLLAAWAAADGPGGHFAWFAIDEGDNDPLRFWTYVIEALRAVEPSIGVVSSALLHAPGTSPVDLAVQELINEIAVAPSPIVLAIDDYHLITKPEIHASLAFLVDHLPSMLHIAIATRAQPDLPVAKLRARGELIEMDTAVLGFSLEEAHRFLNEFLDLGLTRDDVRSLRERTEGWAAGLYLAGLSLHDQDDQHRFVIQFAGDDRHIADYLRAEVLARQGDDLRAFLRRTSILDRLCVSLCDAVTATSSSADTLREIERANLFLIPLDTKREWCRYHYLFRDLLRRELKAAEAGVVEDLHRRAAQWLLDSGHISEAIHHTIAAGDFDRACELIAAHWVRFLGVGNDALIVSWLEALPENALLGDARVCVAGALVSVSTNRLDETEGWVAKAKSAAVPGPFMDGYGSIAASVMCARAGHYLGIGSLSETRTAIKEVLPLLEKRSPWRPAWLCTLGLSSYLLGNAQEGIETLEEGLRLGRISGTEIGMVLTLGGLASLRADVGEWDEACELVLEAVTMGSGQASREHWAHGFSRFTHGRILDRRGEFDAAHADLCRGMELIRRGAPIFIAYVLPALASFKNARGDRKEARKLLLEARRIVAACSDPGIVPRLIDKTERRLRLVPSSPAAPFVEELSARELAVLRLLVTTLSQRQIAGRLCVSMNTVKSHTKSIFRKLGVSTRVEAVARGRAMGLI